MGSWEESACKRIRSVAREKRWQKGGERQEGRDGGVKRMSTIEDGAFVLPGTMYL